MAEGRQGDEEVRIGQLVYLQANSVRRGDFAKAILYCQGVGDSKAKITLETDEQTSGSFSQCLFRIDACGYAKNTTEKLREELGERSKGSIVRYGDFVQLFHMQSECFLSFSGESSFEHGHLEVEVTRKPWERSWFTVLSADSSLALGHPVTFSHTLRLAAEVETVEHYLAVSSTLAVLATDKPFDWRLTKVVDFDVGANEIAYLIPITLSHKHFGLRLATKKAGDQRKCQRKKSKVLSPTSPYNRQFTEVAHDLEEVETAVLSAFEEDASCFWRLEAVSSSSTGRLQATKSYFLRNVRSDKYLSLALTMVDSPSERDAFTLRPRHMKSEFLLNYEDVELVNSEGALMSVNARYSKLFHDYGIIPIFTKEELTLSPFGAEVEAVDKVKNTVLTTFEVAIVAKELGLPLLQAAAGSGILVRVLAFLESWESSALTEESVMMLQRHCHSLILTLTDIAAILKSASGDRKKQLQEMLIGMDVHKRLIQVVHCYWTLGGSEPGHELSETDQRRYLCSVHKGLSVDQKQVFRDITYPLFCQCIVLLSSIAHDNEITSRRISDLYEDICIVLPINVKAVGELLIGIFRIVDPKIEDYEEFFAQWIARLETVSDANVEVQTIWVRLVRYLTEEKDSVNLLSQSVVARLLLTGPSALSLLRAHTEQKQTLLEFVNFQGGLSVRVPLLNLSEVQAEYVYQVLMLFCSLCKENNEESIRAVEALGFTPELVLWLIASDEVPLTIREASTHLSSTTIIAQAKSVSLKATIESKVFVYEGAEQELQQYNHGREDSSKQLTALRTWAFKLWSPQYKWTGISELEEVFVGRFAYASVLLVEVMLDRGGATKLFIDAMKIALITLLAALGTNHLSSEHWTAKLMGSKNQVGQQQLTQVTVRTLQFVSEIERHYKICELVCLFKVHIDKDFKTEVVQQQVERVVLQTDVEMVRAAVRQKLANDIAQNSHTERPMLTNPVSRRKSTVISESPPSGMSAPEKPLIPPKEEQGGPHALVPSSTEYLKLLTELLFTASHFAPACMNELSKLLTESINVGSALSARLEEAVLVVEAQESAQAAEVKDLMARLRVLARQVDTTDECNEEELAGVLSRLVALVQPRRHESKQSLKKMQNLMRNFGILPLLTALWRTLSIASSPLSSPVIVLLFALTFDNQLNQEVLKALIEGQPLDMYAPMCSWLLQQSRVLVLLSSKQNSALIRTVLKQVVVAKDRSRMRALAWIECVLGVGESYNREMQIIAANRIIGCIQSSALEPSEPDDQLFYGRLLTLLSRCCARNTFVSSQCRSFMSYTFLQGLLEFQRSVPMLRGLWDFYDQVYIQDNAEPDFSLVVGSMAAFLEEFLPLQRSQQYEELISLAEMGHYELVYPVNNPEIIDSLISGELPTSVEGWKALARGDYWQSPSGIIYLLRRWLKNPKLKQDASLEVRKIHGLLSDLRSDISDLAIARDHLRFDPLLNRLDEWLKDGRLWIDSFASAENEQPVTQGKTPFFTRLLGAVKNERRVSRFAIASDSLDVLLKFQQFQSTFNARYASRQHRNQSMVALIAMIRSIDPFSKLATKNLDQQDLERMTLIVKKMLSDMMSTQLANIFTVFRRLFQNDEERILINSVAFDSGLLPEALQSVTSTEFVLAKSALSFLNVYLEKQTAAFQDKLLRLLVAKDLYFPIFLLLRDQLKVSLDNVTDLGKQQFNSIFAPLLTHMGRKSPTAYKHSGFDRMKQKQVKFCQALVRFTKLCCDNCHLPFQQFLNNQQSELLDELAVERASINIVNTVAVYVVQIAEKSRMYQNFGTPILGTCLDALADYVTGPCVGNQDCLGSNLQFILALNRLYDDAKKAPDSEQWVYVCEMVVSMLLVLIEGKPQPRVVSTILHHSRLEMFHGHMQEIYDKYVRYSRDYLLFDLKPKVPSPDIPYKTLRSLVSLGFSIFRFLTKLKSIEPQLSLELQSPEQSKSMVSIWDRLKLGKLGSLVSFTHGFLEFYESFTGSVEIARGEDIEVHYFQIPWKCKFLTDKTREQLIMEVSRNSHHEKIEDFLQLSALCSVEMDHQLKLYKIAGMKIFSRGWQIYGTVSYLLILAINFMLLVTVSDQSYFSLSSEFNYSILAATVLGAFQIVFALLSYIAYVVEYYPSLLFAGSSGLQLEFSDYPHIDHNDSLLMRRVNEDLDLIIPVKGLEFLSFSFVFLNWEGLYFALFLTASCMAIWNPFWYCFLLLDIIKRSHAVKNILRSITLNWKQLIITTVFGLFIIFIFATIGFTYFYKFYKSDGSAQYITYCTTLYECFFSTLNLGIRMGGGIGDAIASPKIRDSEYWQRVVFDLAFFVIVIIIILNVIFGIIIDTFAELRDHRQALEFDMRNNCYICGKERSTLELRGQGWTKHFLVEHSPLAYLAFIVYLNAKEMNECSGIEKFVKERINANDASFLPTTSKYLKEHEDKEG